MNARLALITTLALASSMAFASGFEKSIPFGGETSGVAGIGTPYMEGSQALFFNPAGLVGEKAGAQDVSVNVSPTFPSWKAPMTSADTQETAANKTLFPFGLMYGNTLNDHMGFGVGVYTSAGAYADYTNITAAGITGQEAKTNLIVTEFAAGVGYRVNDQLKLGAAWRVGMVNADLMIPSGTGQEAFTGMKDTNYQGFKLGAQYKAGEKTMIGLTYRSEMNFKAKGNGSAAGGAVTDGNAKVSTVLPDAWTLGVSNQCLENWKFLGEYVLTKYSKVGNLAVDSTFFSGPIELQMKDETNIRLAAEYKGYSWPIRFGYIWTNAVANPDHTFPTLVPPGPANTITLGTGQTFGGVKVDGGFEYTMASGTQTGYAAKNEVTEYALHLGASYMF